MKVRTLMTRLWLLAFLAFVAFWLFPISNGLTRAVGLALFVTVWLGFMALQWRRPGIRFPILVFTACAAVFLVLPARRRPNTETLRCDYVAGLLRYEGVRYFWGGESPIGIDCSGLIRRGLVDAVFLRGIRTLDPGLVREALSLWWNDATASALGEGHGALTLPLLRVPGINDLDHSQIHPGDLAVTISGIHIMAYLGDRRWIEADPLAGRVITLGAPGDDSWLTTPMKIVRWRILAE